MTVSDLARSRSFYEQVLGLPPREREDGSLSFGAPEPLIELRGDGSASPLDHRATGLFHAAILFPSRRDLAFALARVASTRWPLQGASDHLVSEALYLSDPDGNGIELYRDRPREQWPRSGGRLEMATLPLDLDNLLSELGDNPPPQNRAPEGTRIGHVHLQVADLHEAERFYSGMLGFEVMVRGYPGALFVAAGGYHHHLGLNTWRSAGASPPPPGAVGLRSYEIVLPGTEELDAALDRLRSAELEVTREGAEAKLRDPSDNAIVLRSA